MTNVFQDLWSGWKSFVGEVVGTFRPGTRHSPDLKGVAKPSNKKRFKQELKQLKDPPRRTKRAIKEEREKLEEKQAEVPPDEWQVDPQQPFKIREEFLETPKERTKRIEKKRSAKLTRLMDRPHLSFLRRQLLFMNPGTQKLREAHQAFRKGLEMPKWTKMFLKVLTFTEDELFFEGLPMADDEQKRMEVKKLYFHPGEFSTIHPIYDKLRDQWANISKTNVQKVLRSFEVYQLNFQRRRPPKVLSRMSMKKPGVILADMFFPSKNLGWRKIGGCLTMMDAWSRFVRCYAVERKTKPLVLRGMQQFMREFASHGHMPRIILCDKGSDLAPAGDAIEPYRTKPGPLVFHSTTGKPVNLVEQTQSQIQRRMAVFRTAGLTDDPSTILEDICNSINQQKRPDRGNLTPIQLLSLNKEEIARINDVHRDRTHIPDLKGLRELFPGSHVRILLMTMKEQLQDKVKGFQEKWSRTIFRVRRKQALQGNPSHFRYFLHGEAESYFRHELLWVPSNTDTEVLDGYVVHKEKLIAEDPVSDEEWVP